MCTRSNIFVSHRACKLSRSHLQYHFLQLYRLLDLSTTRDTSQFECSLLQKWRQVNLTLPVRPHGVQHCRSHVVVGRQGVAHSSLHESLGYGQIKPMATHAHAPQLSPCITHAHPCGADIRMWTKSPIADLGRHNAKDREAHLDGSTPTTHTACISGGRQHCWQPPNAFQ